jgi:hypothetical protein
MQEFNMPSVQPNDQLEDRAMTDHQKSEPLQTSRLWMIGLISVILVLGFALVMLAIRQAGE